MRITQDINWKWNRFGAGFDIIHMPIYNCEQRWTSGGYVEFIFVFLWFSWNVTWWYK